MERDCEIFLDKLRQIGVVHPQRKRVPSAFLGRQDMNRKALNILCRYPVKKEISMPPLSIVEGKDMTAHILARVDEKEVLQKQLVHLEKEARRVEAWGDFDPHDFAYLSHHGVKLFLYSLSLYSLNRMGDEIKLIVFSRDKQWAKVLAVGEEIPGLAPFKLPSHSLSSMKNRINAIRSHIEGIETELADLAYHKEVIEADMNRITGEIDYEMARAGMGTLKEESINTAVSWLSGFVPDEKIDTVIQAAKDNGWTLAWDDPTPADRPPTILRNGPAVRIIQPLFSMLGTIPGYWEYDISLSYMVFLSVFFAMIFGDAGYGLLLFALGAALGVFFKKKNGQFPDAAKLAMLFSSCTVVWGAITGAWFAIPVGNLPAVLRSLIVPPFNNSGPVAEFPRFLQKAFRLPEEIPMDDLKTKWNIQFLCFSIGMIQVFWARTKNIRKLLPSLTAVAEAGWILAMTGIYFLVLFMLLKMPPPSFAPVLIAAGIALNFIFAEQKGGNFFLNILKSFSNFFSIFLKAIGGFGDIISYIRLFAVGMAGGMIARTFNSMAIPPEGLGSFSLGFVLRLFIAVLVLVGGHGLNLLMSTLSLIIHGVRLNLLEYAGNHLGMDWSGYAYEHFALRQNELKKEESL